MAVPEFLAEMEKLRVLVVDDDGDYGTAKAFVTEVARRHGSGEKKIFFVLLDSKKKKNVGRLVLCQCAPTLF